MKIISSILLCFALSMVNVVGQQTERFIEGVVLHEYDRPVEQVDVLIEGKEILATTGNDGKFKVGIRKGAKYISLLRMGYLAQRINIVGHNDEQILRCSIRKAKETTIEETKVVGKSALTEV